LAVHSSASTKPRARHFWVSAVDRRLGLRTRFELGCSVRGTHLRIQAWARGPLWGILRSMPTTSSASFALRTFVATTLLLGCGDDPTGSDSSAASMSSSTSSNSSSDQPSPAPDSTNPAQVDPVPTTPPPLGTAPVDPAPVDPAPVDPSDPGPGNAAECGEAQRGAVVCTQQYDPVCGQFATPPQCFAAPCPDTMTFGNACEACADESIARYTPGECGGVR
jgi:hypothetical protein